MKEGRYCVELDDYEHGIVIDSLNEKKKDLKEEGRATDAVDELIVKVGLAPQKKFKIANKGRNRDEAR